MRQEQLDQGILAILDETFLSVAKVTDEVIKARQRSTGYPSMVVRISRTKT
jgi:hypothetical protein